MNGSDGSQERDEGSPRGEEGMVGEEEATTDTGTQNPTSKQTGSAVKVPKWYTEGAAKFSEVDRSIYGDQWFMLVNLWKGQEERYGYLSNGPEMSKLHWPPQVGTWVKSAWFFHCIPNIPDPMEFTEQWWAWWHATNPSWQVSDSSDALLNEGGGTLDVLLHPGTMAYIAINNWKEAVDDMSWVLKQLAKENQDEPTEEQPLKQ
ncbi:hypothetical protein BDN71DRAFT_1514394 [Pleurotus eryngii]|uniref:Uncharacterized protein n=1 Tax=Pleurotus eryngii TaxID=5323 RepID=A0A9P6CZZ7_PLEER|nr:hypothetical protein BDN71DRAFT_1514394 [Pleurotus eryngii]